MRSDHIQATTDLIGAYRAARTVCILVTSVGRVADDRCPYGAQTSGLPSQKPAFFRSRIQTRRVDPDCFESRGPTGSDWSLARDQRVAVPPGLPEVLVPVQAQRDGTQEIPCLVSGPYRAGASASRYGCQRQLLCTTGRSGRVVRLPRCSRTRSRGSTSSRRRPGR